MTPDDAAAPPHADIPAQADKPPPPDVPAPRRKRETPLTALFVGDRLRLRRRDGRYLELPTTLLAKAGQSQVFTVTWPTGVAAAVKIFEKSPRWDERARGEIAALQRLAPTGLSPQHLDDNIVDDDQRWVAMTLIQGVTLEQLYLISPPTFEDICQVGIALCRELNRLHDAGLQHRDLSPRNVLLQVTETLHQDGTLTRELVGVVLIDFGYVLMMDGTQSNEFSFVHTWGYIPLERYDALHYEHYRHFYMDEATREQAWTLHDVYAVGAMIYFLCTGHEPWRGSTWDLMKAEEPLNLTARAAAKLQTALSGALHLDYERRFSLTQLAEELTMALQIEQQRQRQLRLDMARAIASVAEEAARAFYGPGSDDVDTMRKRQLVNAAKRDAAVAFKPWSHYQGPVDFDVLRKNDNDAGDWSAPVELEAMARTALLHVVDRVMDAHGWKRDDTAVRAPQEDLVADVVRQLDGELACSRLRAHLAQQMQARVKDRADLARKARDQERLDKLKKVAGQAGTEAASALRTSGESVRNLSQTFTNVAPSAIVVLLGIAALLGVMSGVAFLISLLGAHDRSVLPLLATAILNDSNLTWQYLTQVQATDLSAKYAFGGVLIGLLTFVLMALAPSCFGSGRTLLGRAPRSSVALLLALPTVGALIGLYPSTPLMPVAYADNLDSGQVPLGLPMLTEPAGDDLQVQAGVTVGGAPWRPQVTVTPGTKVRVRLQVRNTTDKPIPDVAMKAALPHDLPPEGRAVELVDGTRQDIGDSLLDAGMQSGPLEPGELEVFEFDLTAAESRCRYLLPLSASQFVDDGKVGTGGWSNPTITTVTINLSTCNGLDDDESSTFARELVSGDANRPISVSNGESVRIQITTSVDPGQFAQGISLDLSRGRY